MPKEKEQAKEKTTYALIAQVDLVFGPVVLPSGSVLGELQIETQLSPDLVAGMILRGGVRCDVNVP